MDSDLLLILTDHDEFKEIKAAQLDGMAQKNIFDTKSIFLSHQKLI